MFTVRRLRAADWEAARMLRLAALADPAAPIAFLESLEDAMQRPAEFWIARAEQAATGSTAQFVAEGDDGSLWGTVVVLVFEAGDTDYYDRNVTAQRANLVGVFVRPEHRGKGIIDALIEEAKRHTRSLGLEELHLEVHADNAPARRSYERAGFVATGGIVTTETGDDLEMVAQLSNG